MKNWLISAILAAISLTFGHTRAAAADPPAVTTTADLELQVAVLTTLNELDVTSDQLKQLHTLATDTAAEAQPNPAAEKTSAQYRSALRALRDALLADSDNADAAQEKVDDLRDSENIVPTIDYSLTDAAKTKARAAVKILSTSQIAGFVALHADEVPDATDTIEDALDQCKDGSDKDFEGLRSEAADQVATLAGGIETRPGQVASQRVIDLLNRARKLTAAELDDRRPEFDRAAQAITRGTDSFEALHRWMIRQIAILLSNPRFLDMVDGRIKAENQG
jgi:hypothetical protein